MMNKKIYKLPVIMLACLLASCGEAPEKNQSDKDISLVKQDYRSRPIQDDLFYFVMTDRFSNGDPGNDHGSPDQPVFSGGFDPTSDRKFHGGDLKGLMNKLDYIKGLGVTALWMTPFMGNKVLQGDVAGYHGYWIVDFLGVDPHLGSKQDLKDLIAAAHERDIKVFFDIVVNHTGDVVKYKECHHPDGSRNDQECSYKSQAEMKQGDPYTPFIPAGEENVKNPAWLNDLANYSNRGDSLFRGESVLHGDFAGLDDIKTADPGVRAGLIEIFKSLISEYKPDGFRIDTAKFVRLDFWQEFSPIISQHARSEGIENFHFFGEAEIHEPQALSQYTTEGMLPSVLDFPFQDAMEEVFAGKGGTNILKSLFDQDHYYRDQDSNASMLMTYIGNHDDGRFGYFVNRDLPDASEEEKLERVKLAHAFMYFARGVPILYYGAEQGFTGGGLYEGSREDMMPSQVARYHQYDLLGTDKNVADDNFDVNHPLYQTFKAYAEIYHENRALRHGDHKTLYASDKPGIYAFSRTDEKSGQALMLLFNISPEMKTARFAAPNPHYRALGDNKALNADADQTLSVSVPPLSFTIYQAVK